MYMKKGMLMLLIWVFACLGIQAQNEIKITLKNGSEAEKQTKLQLERLLKTYDLSKWTFTKEIAIDQTAIPHSHPVLTFSTSHLKDDDLLVSTFIHEQAHRFLTDLKNKETNEAVKELQVLFPKVPSGGPEGGRDERSTYAHLLVIYLEYRGITEIFGELKAKQIMEFWATDHYTWIYKTLLDPKSRSSIEKIMFKNKLFP
jgi:hypothetical protein